MTNRTPVLVSRKRAWGRAAQDALFSGKRPSPFEVHCPLRFFKLLCASRPSSIGLTAQIFAPLYISFPLAGIENLLIQLQVYPDDELSTSYKPTKNKTTSEVVLPIIEVSDALLPFFPEQLTVNKSTLHTIPLDVIFVPESEVMPWKSASIQIEGEFKEFTAFPSLHYLRDQLAGVVSSSTFRIPIQYGTGDHVWISGVCEGEQGAKYGRFSAATLLDCNDPTQSPAASIDVRPTYDGYLADESVELSLLLQHARFKKNRPIRTVLLHGAAGTGKSYLVVQLAAKLGFRLETVTTTDILDAKVTNPFARILRQTLASDEADELNSLAISPKCQDSIIFFDDIDILLSSDEVSDLESQHNVKMLFSEFISDLVRLAPTARACAFLIGATNAINTLDISLRRLFEREVRINYPTPQNRRQLLNCLLQQQTTRDGLLIHSYVWSQVDNIADICHGFSVADVETMIHNAIFNCRLRSSLLRNPDDSPQLATLTLEDMMLAKKQTQPESLKSETMLVTSSASTISASQIGGLEDQYEKLLQSTVWIYKHHDKFAKLGIEAPKGILLFGPPGTGKTMLAKVVAHESHANFLSVSISDLVKGEVGASEEAIATLFNKARATAPCIVFLDEIQAMFGSRDSSGAHSKNMISQLLLEMDAMPAEVIVIGATNRPDWLDSSLLRPGRFERCLYIPPPPVSARAHILATTLKNMHVDTSSVTPEFIQELAVKTDMFTGADLHNLCLKAAWNVLKEQQPALSRSESITKQHLTAAKAEFSPTVTTAMLVLYEQFQNKYGRAVLQEQAQTDNLPQNRPEDSNEDAQPPMSRSERFRRDRLAQADARMHPKARRR